jgi:hypothetical protein
VLRWRLDGTWQHTRDEHKVRSWIEFEALNEELIDNTRAKNINPGFSIRKRFAEAAFHFAWSKDLTAQVNFNLLVKAYAPCPQCRY